MTIEFYRLWSVVGVIMILAVCVGSLVPPPPYPTIEGSDKLVHLVSYGTLAYWWGMLRPQQRHRWALSGMFVALGVALEFAQGATGYRTFDVFDMAANAVGVLCGRLAVETPLGGLLAAIDRMVAALRARINGG